MRSTSLDYQHTDGYLVHIPFTPWYEGGLIPTWQTGSSVLSSDLPSRQLHVTLVLSLPTF